jgi:hypothetical protein
MSKAQETKTTLPAAFARHYEKLGIDANLRDLLETSAARVFDLGRRSTEQAFILGEILDEAAVLLQGGTFGKWVKKRCGIAPRTASGYIAVHRNLADFRDDLVDLSVGSTVLFHLAHASHDKIRASIAHAEEHGQLRVFDVKAILTNGDEAQEKAARDDVHGAGGVTGLKALIAIKTRDGLKMFVLHIEVILQAIETALGQKRVIKEALAREVEDLSRVARMELESLAQFVEPDGDLRRYPRSTQFPKGSEWAVVNETLQKLGLLDAWPKSKELPGWLRNEVVPVLEWAISKERKPKWPLAVSGDEAMVPIVIEDADEQEAAEADADLDRFAERFGKQLEQATGGMISVSRETPKARKPVEAVPPLAAELEVDGSDEVAPAVTA